MRENFKLHNYAKRDKVNLVGDMPVYIRLTVDGKRYEFSTKKFVNPKLWSSTVAKMKGTSEEACSVNGQLNILKIKIIDAHMDLVYNNIPVTAESIKSKFLGQAEEPRMLIPIFEDHNNKIKELIGIEYAAGTLERYVTSLYHTREFMLWKCRK